MINPNSNLFQMTEIPENDGNSRQIILLRRGMRGCHSGGKNKALVTFGYHLQYRIYQLAMEGKYLPAVLPKAPPAGISYPKYVTKVSSFSEQV